MAIDRKPLERLEQPWHGFGRNPFAFVARVAQKALPLDLLLLIQRFGIAAIFFLSGRTKVDGWFTLTISTAVTLYSGQLVAQSEKSVVITLACVSGWWKVV